MRPSDEIRHSSLLTLVQVMTCCLTATRHYLNQCSPYPWNIFLWNYPWYSKVSFEKMHLKKLPSKLWPFCPSLNMLTHWGRVKPICVSKPNSIGSDNGLLPGRHQPIIWTNAEILLIWPLGTNFSEMLIKIHTFSFNKMLVKMSFGKWGPFCLASIC